jgi:hypothetical protein
MRVTRWAHTTSWGLVLAFGLLLPVAPYADRQRGQSVPAPAPAPTPPTAGPPPAPVPFALKWAQPIDSVDTTLRIVLTGSGVVLMGDHTALEARANDTGTVAWTNDQVRARTLASGEGLVFAVTEDAVVALDERTGATRWRVDTGPGDAHLLTDRGWLFATRDRTLRAYRASDGGEIWRVTLDAPITTTPGLTAATVVVGLANGELACVDLSTGTVVWRITLPRAVAHVATRTDASLLYAGLAGGLLCARHVADGAPAWCFDFGVPLGGAPLVSDRFVSVALFDNTLRVLDAHNGALRQQDRLGARPATGPIAAGSLTVVPLTNGALAPIAADGKVLPRVPAAVTTIAQSLERVSIRREADAIATLTISPGGLQTLALYARASATPAPAAPPPPGDTGSGTPTASPAPSPRTPAPEPPTAPPAGGR